MSAPGGFAGALDRGQYELAALRLLLGVMRAIEDTSNARPQVRDELLALLGGDGERRERGRR